MALLCKAAICVAFFCFATLAFGGTFAVLAALFQAWPLTPSGAAFCAWLSLSLASITTMIFAATAGEI